MPIVVGKKAVKDLNDRLEVEDALQDKSISVIASGNIQDKRTLYGYDLIPYNGIQHSKIAVLANKNLIRIIVGSANLTENAQKHQDLIHFYPISIAAGTEGRDLHAKLVFISTNKANYLLVGSSNFTKKGFGFEKVKPNAEANLLFKVHNPDERKLKNFLPPDIAEQKIEFLRHIPPDIKGEDTDNPLPQIITYAYYKDGHLTIEFGDACYDRAYNWEIFLTNEKILDASGWDKERKFEKEISLPDMAQKSLDLEIRMDSGTYYYPIFFYDSSQLVKERHKNIPIDADSLILYWLNRISRPKTSEGVIHKPGNGYGKPTKPIETPDLLMSKIKTFIKALEGVREYLKEDKIANSVMLNNRIYGVFGVDRIFKIVNDLDDKPTKLFCYSEIITIINDISLPYKDGEKRRILDEYKLKLRDKTTEFKQGGLSREWQIYLKYAEA